MFRIAIIFISLVWASLLLISWGGNIPTEVNAQQVVISDQQ
ncbi:hypothetical protein [Malonomonas rubra]|nr:hypothetical protein [Malonomonas rubra]